MILTPLAEQIYRRADRAMYEAKSRGSGVFVFDPAIPDNDQRLRDILKGIAEKEFILHYQPIVDLRTRETVGYEALCRWQRGDELIYPAEFIELLENSGNLHFLCRQVFQMAATAQHQLIEQGKPQWISINLSPTTLVREDFADIIKPLKGVEHLEVTERLKLSEQALQRLEELANAIAVDDFGSGASRFMILRLAKLLKIDASLTEKIVDDQDAAALCTVLVALGRAYPRLKIAAEGVETKEQADLLQCMGCDYAQGYFFGRPGPMLS